MYGYYTGRDEDGSMTFQTWVFVRKQGLSDQKIEELLSWGEQAVLANRNLGTRP
jgi:hypothetical protein